MMTDIGIKEWLIRSMNRHPYHSNAYQYAYIIPIRDQKVIATATGHTAHFSWDISEIVQYVVCEHDKVQIVDFGFGLNVEAAKQWNPIDAFTHLLSQIFAHDAFRVDRDLIVDAVNHYDRFSEHGLEEDSIATIQIRYSTGRLFLMCSDDPKVYDFMVKALPKVEELQITIQGNYLKNALMDFTRENTVECRISTEPPMIAIGTESEKVAIIMGIVSVEEK